MLLLRYRTPIQGSNHTLKISMLNGRTRKTEYSPIKSEIQKKKLNKMLLQGFKNTFQGCDHTLKIFMSNHNT